MNEAVLPVSFDVFNDFLFLKFCKKKKLSKTGLDPNTWLKDQINGHLYLNETEVKTSLDYIRLHRLPDENYLDPHTQKAIQ